MRLTHLADYAVVLMTAAARRPAAARLSATELAGETGVPLPTAQKLMGQLAECGLLTSVRGAGGGFALARPAGDQPRRRRRGGRRPDRHDRLLGRRGPVRLRARRALPGQAAHGDRRNAVRGALGAVSLERYVHLRRQVPSRTEEILGSCLRRSAVGMTEDIQNREVAGDRHRSMNGASSRTSSRNSLPRA